MNTTLKGMCFGYSLERPLDDMRILGDLGRVRQGVFELRRT